MAGICFTAVKPVFYACGSPEYFFLFFIMVIVDTVLAHVLHYTVSTTSSSQNRRKKPGKTGSAHSGISTILLCVGICLNLGLLFYYKYFSFCIYNVNRIFGTAFTAKNLLQPLGISFFVFKAVSLLVDVYRGDKQSGVTLSKNFAQTALYLSFFAQVVSGPICRYGEFYEYANANKGKGLSGISWNHFVNGSYRFVCGFCKKYCCQIYWALLSPRCFRWI